MKAQRGKKTDNSVGYTFTGFLEGVKLSHIIAWNAVDAPAGTGEFAQLI
jgi:hypothetical protein